MTSGVPTGLSLVLAALLRQRRRLALALVAIALGVGYLAGALTLLARVGSGLDRIAAAGAERADLVVVGPVAYESPVEQVRALVPATLAEQIAGIEGVTSASPRTEGPVVIVAPDGRPVVPLGLTEQPLGLDWPLDPAVLPTPLAIGGRAPGPGEVVIDHRTARQAGVGLGSSLGLAGRSGVSTVRVVGVLGATDLPSGASLAFVERGTAEALFGQSGYVNRIAVRLGPGADAASVAERVRLVGGVEVLDGATAEADRADSLTRSFAVIRWLVIAFAVLALFVATITVTVSLSLLFVERGRVFALLRLAGASPRTLLTAAVAEVGAVATAAALLGIPVGWGIGRVLEAVVARLGPAIPVAGPTVVTWALVAAAATGIVVALLVGIAPARRAATVSPLGAVTEGRAVVPVGRVRGVLTAPARLVGNLVGEIVYQSGKRGEPTAAIASRSIRDRPGRTSATVLSIGVATAVIVTISVLLSSVTASARAGLDESVTADLVVDSGTFTRGGLPDGLIDTLRRTEGVAGVSGIAIGRGWVEGRSVRLTGVSGVDMLRVLRPRTDPSGVAGVDADSVLISKELAGALGVGAGSSISLQFTNGAVQPFRVLATMVGQSALLGDVVIERSVLANQIPTTVDIVALVALADPQPGPGRDAAVGSVRAAAAAAGVDGVADPGAFLDRRAGLLRGAEQVIRWMLAFTLLQALVGVVNTNLLSVSERYREFGLLRVAGATPRRLSRMVLREGFALSAVGAVIGLGVGLVMARAAVASLAGFGLGTFSLSPAVVLVLPPVIALGVAASWWPARVAASTSPLDLVVDAGERRLRTAVDLSGMGRSMASGWARVRTASAPLLDALMRDRRTVPPVERPRRVDATTAARPDAPSRPIAPWRRRRAQRARPATPIFVPIEVTERPGGARTGALEPTGGLFAPGADTHHAGLEAVYERLSPATRWECVDSKRVAASLLNRPEAAGERVTGMCAGILNGHMAVAVVTDRRTILAVDRDGRAVIDTVHRREPLTVELHPERGRASVVFRRGDAHLILRHVRDVNRAEELVQLLGH